MVTMGVFPFQGKTHMLEPGFFFCKHSFISHSLLYIGGKLLPAVRTKHLREGRTIWSVAQARGKVGDRMVSSQEL